MTEENDNKLFIIKTPIFKLLIDEIDDIIKKIGEKYDLDYNELKDIAFKNSKLAIKYGIKKRVKRKIEKCNQCMGRKIDREQCTRSRRDGTEFCRSHQKNLKYGRIDDNNFVDVQKQRGRKKKTDSSDYCY